MKSKAGSAATYFLVAIIVILIFRLLYFYSVSDDWLDAASVKKITVIDRTARHDLDPEQTRLAVSFLNRAKTITPPGEIEPKVYPGITDVVIERADQPDIHLKAHMNRYGLLLLSYTNEEGKEIYILDNENGQLMKLLMSAYD